ncbi:MAG: DUF1553 domain-containing protein [Fuerstiella sp.]
MLMKSACIAACLIFALPVEVAGDDRPVAYWDFQQLDQLDLHGPADAMASRLTAPVYPLFGEANQALHLTAPAWVAVSDPGDDSQYDFDNGDEVTFEAWVRLDQMGDQAYLIGKGRTEQKGPHSYDQNWAFRLRRSGGTACVNFLFRSADSEKQKGEWHRWTSDLGLSAGARWHHVALRYRFGSPESIRAFVNGQPSDGKWDMAGATKNAPVVNDEDVWIGSSMGGNVGNSLTGAIDELKIHRRLVSDEELQSHFSFTPPDTTPKSIPAGRVFVQMMPTGSHKKFDDVVQSSVLEWHQPEFAFHEMPQVYDEWGIREDTGSTLLIRAWSMVTLPKGQYQLLVRARGLSRLTIGDQQVATLSAAKHKSGAHNHVIALPETSHPNLRPHAMNEQEQLVEFVSDGRSQRWLFETIVGGSSYRPEFGETCVAVTKSEGMFRLVSTSSDSESKQYLLTDEGWRDFRNDHRDLITELNFQNRAIANRQKESLWEQRHQLATNRLLSNKVPRTIDQVIQESVDHWNEGVAQNLPTVLSSTRFQDQVQPLLQSACGRCHGQKEHGGFSILDRDRLLAGGESGEAAIVPGQPEGSYLMELISADVDDYRMPPKGDGLDGKQIEIIRRWIKDGAAMPERSHSLIAVPAVVDDLTFLRRVYLDTVGVIPSLEEIQWFQTQDQETRRLQVVDHLLQDRRWADHWVGYWQDVFAENPNLLKPTLNNTGPFRFWIHEALADNKPMDRFATELILMRGSQWRGGTAGFAVASQNDSPMAAKAHVITSAFLGLNMKCARCHDAPYHEHTQSDLFQVAAMLKRQPIKLLESSTVPAAFFAKQQRAPLIEATLKAGELVQPKFPFHSLLHEQFDPQKEGGLDLRLRLALQVTGSRRFAEVMANRIWARLMGVGLVEPVDDWEANPASNPELLSLLADQFIHHNYDSKQFVRQVLLSEAYQRVAVNRSSSRRQLFAGPYRRRMTAEQVVDSSFVAAGQSMVTEELTMDVEGLLPGDRFLNFRFPRRAWEFTTLANERDRPSLALPRAQPIVDVLTAFGWRDSRPEPLSKRSTAANVIQPGVLANGSLGLQLTRITDDTKLLSVLLKSQTVDQLADDLYLCFLTRYPTTAERKEFRDLLAVGFAERVIPKAERALQETRRRHRYVSWSNHLHTDANVIKAEIQEEVRQGPVPTNCLATDWRERAEDAIWVLLNAPEMVTVP